MESIVVLDDQESLKEFLEEAELKQYFELFRDILKITKLSQLKFVATEDLAQIGLSKPEQRRYKKIYSKFFPNPYLDKIKRFFFPIKKNDPDVQDKTYVPVEYQPFADSNVKMPTKHIIPMEDITLNNELGMGQFGVVQQGTWITGNQRLQVAIKCLGSERMTSNSTEFLKEAAVMHSIEHPNIVRLYGVVLHMDSLMLVTELAPLRSLLECVREVSLRPNFPVANLCEFAEQICAGMAYLETKRLIHRDLAARNILVFTKDKVKISDFGLSRALGAGKDYYQTNYNVNLKLPVAWCAPECILFLRFTSWSDVWAFGVTLWEMFTYGFQPWAAFSGQQILEAIDKPNHQRLERPDCCPESYYTVMSECWAHLPHDRPRFRELVPKLRAIRPEQVQTTTSYYKSGKGRRNNLLEYKTGEIITVLGKESMTDTALWYGVLRGGACGVFDPNNTKPLNPNVEKSSSISPRSIRDSVRFSLLRSDVKRHTYTGKRTVQRPMISSPQGEVVHTGHVGLDGAFFGDISFLDPAGCPPRQVVTPYKPSEDLEQMPLINPNSPSHLTVCPYPLLSKKTGSTSKDAETKGKGAKKSTSKSVSEPTTSKSILNKVKSATLGRSHKNDDSNFPSTSKTDEVHEYHEISDTDTESTEQPKPDTSENTGGAKCSADFSQSLLDEMESMFKSLETRPNKAEASTSRHGEAEPVGKSHTMTKSEKKRQDHHYSGTMKPMSAHDEKTLNTAVALANEIITKSMYDTDKNSKVPPSPSDKNKFHIRFPLSLHNTCEGGKDITGKQEPRRNFSEEARSVPNIQESLTEESKQAYTSLIEQPSTSSLIPRLPKDPMEMAKPSTIPKPARTSTQNKLFNSLQAQSSQNNRPSPSERDTVDNGSGDDESKNEIPLPPRATKPKLVDKPRHIRKYPLKLPSVEPTPKVPPRPIIYQNTGACASMDRYRREMECSLGYTIAVEAGRDVFDGAASSAGGSRPAAGRTNPFSNAAPSTSANPFICAEKGDGREDGERFSQAGALVKDYVSVEDLLEFADQKPCGRQRGVESDEVRIMNKVLKEQVTPEECLEALELSEWNVHQAIKLVRVRIAAGGDVSLGACSDQLRAADGDIVKASAVLILSNK